MTQFIYGDNYSDLTSTIVDAVSGGLQLTTQYTYDAGGNVITSIAPKDSGKNPIVLTGYAYDADRRLAAIARPSPGNSLPATSTAMAYDDDGQVLNVTRSSGTSAANQVTLFTYTPTEKVATTVDPSNDTVTYSYDIVDRLVATTDGQARVVSQGYDADSRVNLICQGNAAFNGALPCQGETPTEQRTCWPNGPIKQRLYETASNGWQGLTYQTDGYDRLQEILYPDGTFEKMQHNASDDVLNHTSRGGEMVSWTYDNLHRMVTKTGLPNLAYGYDQASDLTSVTVTGTNGSGYGGVLTAPYAMGYDRAERKISDTGVLGTVTYGLDANGNRTSLTYPNGTVIPTQFDELNRPGLTQGFGATAGAGIITTRFDGFDRPYSTLLGSVWYMNYSYDQGNHQVNLGFNGQGLDLTRLVDFQGSSTSSDFHFGFDLAHKANSQVTYPASAIVHPTAGNTLAGLVANTNNEVVGARAPLSYNADGYLTGDGVRGYTYDGDGYGHILSATNGSTTAGYHFDAFGRRIYKTVDGNITQYLLDDQGHEIDEYDSSGNVQRYLVYSPYQTAPAVSLDTNGNPSFYEVDRIGSVIATSTGSTLASTYAYLPYGDTPTGAPPAGTNFGYAGYRNDYETGTYHTASREYDPRLGRFLQSDPIGQASDKNIYAYAGGDPINGADPSGLDDDSISINSDGTATASFSLHAHAPSGLSPSQGAFGGSGSGGNRQDGSPGTIVIRPSGGGGSAGGGMAGPTGGGTAPASPPPVFSSAVIAHIVNDIHITEQGYTGAPDLPLGAGGFLAMATLPVGGEGFALESVRKVHAGLQSFRSMRRMEASRRNASALRL